jgi:ribosomal protein S18 acetylase RimI-like enzyme
VADEVAIVRAGRERIAELEPLWYALHEYHVEVAKRPTHIRFRPAAEAWRRRKRSYERWLQSPGSFLFVAEQAGKPVGYALVHFVEGYQSFNTQDRIAELASLSVLPEQRGHGIGSRLFAAVERELARQDISDLTISVAVGNERAARFYERRGFGPAAQVLLGRVSRPSNRSQRST